MKVLPFDATATCGRAMPEVTSGSVVRGWIAMGEAEAVAARNTAIGTNRFIFSMLAREV